MTSRATHSQVPIVLIEVRTEAEIAGMDRTSTRSSPKAYTEPVETPIEPRFVGQDARNISGLREVDWGAVKRPRIQ